MAARYVPASQRLLLAYVLSFDHREIKYSLSKLAKSLFLLLLFKNSKKYSSLDIQEK